MSYGTCGNDEDHYGRTMCYGTCGNNEDHYGRLCNSCGCCKECCDCAPADCSAGVYTTDPAKGLAEVPRMEDEDGADSDEGRSGEDAVNGGDARP